MNFLNYHRIPMKLIFFALISLNISHTVFAAAAAKVEPLSPDTKSAVRIMEEIEESFGGKETGKKIDKSLFAVHTSTVHEIPEHPEDGTAYEADSEGIIHEIRRKEIIRSYYLLPEFFDSIQEAYPFIEYDPDAFSNPEGISSMSHKGFIPQGKGMLVDSSADYSLCTNFLGDCVALAVYKPETGQRFLGHIHFPVSTEVLENLLETLRTLSKDDPSSLKMHARTSILTPGNISYVEFLRSHGYDVKLSAAKRALIEYSLEQMVGHESFIPENGIDQHRALAIQPDGKVVKMVHADTEPLFPLILSGSEKRPEDVSEENWSLYLDAHKPLSSPTKLDKTHRPGVSEYPFTEILN